MKSLWHPYTDTSFLVIPPHPSELPAPGSSQCLLALSSELTWSVGTCILSWGCFPREAHTGLLDSARCFIGWLWRRLPQSLYLWLYIVPENPCCPGYCRQRASQSHRDTTGSDFSGPFWALTLMPWWPQWMGLFGVVTQLFQGKCLQNTNEW